MEINLSIDLDVHYGFVHLVPEDEPGWDLSNAAGGQANGLCGAQYPGALAMITGLHTGTVPFELVVSDHEPAIGEEWEEVVEASFSAPQRHYLLRAFEDGLEFDLPAATSYRARYCALGMDEAHQGDVRMPDEPVIDRYLLQLWPAPPAPDAVVRQTSEIAAYWHKEARTTAPPAPQELAAEAAESDWEWVEEDVEWVELDPWDGNPPGRLLQAGGPAALRLALTDRELAEQLASFDPGRLRQVAHWAASAACARARDAALDWAPALEALAQGRPLPAPFDDPASAWEGLYGSGERLTLAVVVGDGTSTFSHPAHAALATLLAAANPDPAVAAFDSLEQLGGTVDSDSLFAALRPRFGLR